VTATGPQLKPEIVLKAVNDPPQHFAEIGMTCAAEDTQCERPSK